MGDTEGCVEAVGVGVGVGVVEEKGAEVVTCDSGAVAAHPVNAKATATITEPTAVRVSSMSRG